MAAHFDGMTCKCGFKTKDEGEAMNHVKQGCNKPMTADIDKLKEICPEALFMLGQQPNNELKVHMEAVCTRMLALAGERDNLHRQVYGLLKNEAERLSHPQRRRR